MTTDPWANYEVGAKKSPTQAPEKEKIRVLPDPTDSSLFRVLFDYDPDLVAAIKDIPGRRCVWENKKVKWWSVPATETSRKKLIEIGAKPPEIAPKFVRTKLPQKKLKLEGFGFHLRPYQEAGVQFLESVEGKGIIGDEMGLGKTIQALAYIHMHPELRPAAIVCPASLKINWQREAEKGIPDIKIHTIEGRPEAKNLPLPKADLYIINYDIMPRRRMKIKTVPGMKDRREPIKNTGWVDYLSDVKLVVFDEGHRLANWSADRTKDTVSWIRQIKPDAVIPMSGTPITSRPIQFFTLLNMVAPKGKIPPWKTFGITYCGGTHNGYGWNFTGSSNEEALHILIQGLMIRRLKKDVLKELPDKIRSTIPLQITGKAAKEYWRAETDFISWLQEIDPTKVKAAERAKALAEFQALKTLAVKAKWNEGIDWIKSALDENGKMIIFATHHKVIDDLMAELKDFNPVKLDGRDSQTAKQAAVDRFQTDDSCRAFVGNIKAAGEGITLTSASQVAFMELPWTPGAMEQASDRAHRIGQKNTVNVYYLLAENTVEERIAALLDAKRETLTKILDGGDVEEGSMILELLKEMRDKNKSLKN